ncbi:MAG: hypothetical protein F7C35_07580 [Desulfurococcales archaeon]|nr:hypothetical protein [Desulfurococcales archaeon]
MDSDWDVGEGVTLLIERQLSEALLSGKYSGPVVVGSAEALAREVERLRSRVLSLEIRVLELYKILKRMRKELKELKRQVSQCGGDQSVRRV